MNLVAFPSARPASAALGGKGAALAALDGVVGSAARASSGSCQIPPWFAVTPDGFHDSAEACGVDGDGIPRGLSTSLGAAIEAGLARLGSGARLFAVRSSAADEDGRGHSFAGLLESYLDVPASDVGARVVDVWRSGFSPRVRAYRARRGLPPPTVPPSVLVQEMVASEVAGVAFGADARAGRRCVLVSAVRGLGSCLVDGTEDGDLYAVEPDGRVVVERAEAAGLPLLSDERVRQVASLVRAVEAARGEPQDVEWAFAGGTLFLLQARPITAGVRAPAARGLPVLWDDSNIAESYPGLTAPLTFSFLRRAYEEVYRSFARVMGVRARRIADEGTTFRGMLGYHRGRVFYNLVHWYRVVAMLPGYRWNRQFLEEMLGVKDALPEALKDRAAEASTGSRIADLLRLARTGCRLVGNWMFLGRSVRAYERRLDDALAAATPGLEAASIDDLAARYRELERRLLAHWHAPIVNDFFGMVAHGALRRVAARWCDDDRGALANGLLSAAGEVVSHEPALRCAAIARLVGDDGPLVEALASGDRVRAEHALARRPDVAAAVAEWLARFGDRAPEELKLESPTMSDDPRPLHRAVAEIAARETRRDARRGAMLDVGLEADDPAAAARLAARREVGRRLRWHPIRRAILAFAASQARRRLRGRENLRFARTRLFGVVRRILREMGARLAAAGALASAEDVFFLEVEEVLGFVEGTATCRDLRALVDVRAKERERFESASPLPSRFLTHGVADADRAEPCDSTSGGSEARAGRGPRGQGLGVSGGRVTGRARVVRDPRTAVLEEGDILVAERTDPGWILLFASASALVVEHGSLLSHVAIVARELGIPAVTGVEGAATWIEDGALVTVDGSAGVVTVEPRAGERSESTRVEVASA